MTFERLEDLVHDCTLVQQIGESDHVGWVKHVNLQEVSISNVIAKEWYALDEGDMRHEGRMIAIVQVAAIADSQSMIYGCS